MEIDKKREGELMVLRLKGRLDGHWADHLGREIEELLHTGIRQLMLDLAELAYMSSAGIRILVKYKKSMKSIGGGFFLRNASEFVQGLLVQTGVSALFVESPAPVKAAAAAEPEVVVAIDGVIAKIRTIQESAVLKARLVGNPARMAGAGFELKEAVSLPLSVSKAGIGIGAFGKDLEDCRDRFGELLAVGGTTVYQPTDGAGTPDFMLSRGDFMPTVHVLHALFWAGEYRHFFRFDSQNGQEVIGLSSLARQVLHLEEGRPSVFILLAESAGLMGASLKHSPVGGTSGTIYDHPEIVKWISFAAERVHRRALTLSVGVVAGEADSEISSFLRPLGRGTGLWGHVHAVALSYRILPEGSLRLSSTVNGLLETQDILGILHLLNDDRDISGAGESEFYRGALWAGPIQIEKEA